MGADGNSKEKADDAPASVPPANSHQVGGDHYRAVPGEQHWDRMWRLLGPEVAWAYFVGKITGYVERYRKKNGLQDLRKARHFLDKLIELETEAGIVGDGPPTATVQPAQVTANSEEEFPTPPIVRAD